MALCGLPGVSQEAANQLSWRSWLGAKQLELLQVGAQAVSAHHRMLWRGWSSKHNCALHTRRPSSLDIRLPTRCSEATSARCLERRVCSPSSCAKAQLLCATGKTVVSRFHTKLLGLPNTSGSVKPAERVCAKKIDFMKRAQFCTSILDSDV